MGRPPRPQTPIFCLGQSLVSRLTAWRASWHPIPLCTGRVRTHPSDAQPSDPTNALALALAQPRHALPPRGPAARQPQGREVRSTACGRGQHAQQAEARAAGGRAGSGAEALCVPQPPAVPVFPSCAHLAVAPQSGAACTVIRQRARHTTYPLGPLPPPATGARCKRPHARLTAGARTLASKWRRVGQSVGAGAPHAAAPRASQHTPAASADCIRRITMCHHRPALALP